VASTILAFGLAVGSGLLLNRMSVPSMFAVGLAILQATLLWRATPVSMTVLSLVSLPCGWLASTVCDITPGAATWGILHAGESYLLLLAPYALVRIVTLARTAGPTS